MKISPGNLKDLNITVKSSLPVDKAFSIHVKNPREEAFSIPVKDMGDKAFMTEAGNPEAFKGEGK